MQNQFGRLALVLMVLIGVGGAALAQNAPPNAPSNPPVGAAGIGDSLYPTFGNGGYDVQHYTVDLSIDPLANFIEGAITIEAVASENLGSFNLDFIGFDISSIQVNDGEASASRDGQELTISSFGSLSTGEPFTVEITYSGTPEPLTSVAIPILTGWVHYGEGVFVLGQPDGTASFLPINDHPLDKATYTLRVTVPEPYTVAMNGVVTDTVDNGDTTTTTSEVNHPMASYLLTINVARFSKETEPGTHGVPIRNFFDEGISEAAQAGFARQDEMIGYFERLFGEYPFDVYGAVVVNTETGSALETQTLSIFGADSVDEAEPFNTELIAAHELAHQWFGNSVSVSDWRDIWLNEGWATYAEGLWIANAQGSAAFDQWVRDNYFYAVDVAMIPPGNPPANDLFNWSVYVRGALTLHALRVRIGDAYFFEIAREWLSRYAYGNAGTAEFIALAEEISGQPLVEFFDAWLYQNGIPSIPEMGLGM